jgi:hypothetical protein
MNIFIRSFNSHINSKTGAPLPVGVVRGTPEWGIFEELLGSALRELGCNVLNQPESPLEVDRVDWLRLAHKKIVVHKCKRDFPEYDFFYMQMHMRNLFTLDSNGWGEDHSGNRLFAPALIGDVDARQFCENLSARLFQSGESKCHQPEASEVETPVSFILVPLQIPRDYVLLHHSKVSVNEFIQAVAEWADVARVNVAFKLHPHNRADFDLIKLVNDSCHSSEYVTKIEGNINSLIKKCAGVMVINSGTGFESLIHGKPVVTFGACDYKVATFDGSLHQLNNALEYVSDFSESERMLGYKFCYWYHFHHAYNVSEQVSTRTRLTSYLKLQLGL